MHETSPADDIQDGLSATPITKWYRADRPRERLFSVGAGALTAAELLAICIGSGSVKLDAVQLGQRLLSEFGGLEEVLTASVDELLAIPGLGRAKVATLKAILELNVRRAERAMGKQNQSFNNAQSVCTYVRDRIGGSQREIFACLFLNTRHEFLAWEVMFMGSIDRAHVHAREVLKRGLQLNAAAVVLCHNHPSGVAEPSQADIALTEDLSKLLAQVDIRVVDHVVVARSSAVSMASRGLIPS